MNPEQKCNTCKHWIPQKVRATLTVAIVGTTGGVCANPKLTQMFKAGEDSCDLWGKWIPDPTTSPHYEVLENYVIIR